jgi:CHAT domain-containing protein
MLRHSRVLLPVAIPRDKSRWIIVSNGVLADVPFAALSSSARHYMPVVASHEVIRATSVSSALALAASPDAPFAFSLGKVAVFFDPVFDESDARLASRESAKRVARFGQLPRLAGTAQEAQAIRAALERAEVVTFGGFEATRENALSSNALNASVLHFATHAIARDDWPHGAGLVMSGLGRDGTFRNGFLSTGDLRRRSIATPLVVLSACDTARGDMSSIDGVGGLAREFLASGASNVIASQWQIPDASTAALMRDFYTALRAGAPPSQALRQAQRLALADTRRRNPNHWGAMALYASAPRETQPGP